MNTNTFYQNNVINNINVDSAVSQILSYFDSFYIINVLTDSFNMRYRPYQLPMPNLITAYEERFKMIKDQFPDMNEQTIVKREEVYNVALEKIAEFYNLSLKKEFITADNQYALAYILYQFLFSDFTGSLINFFISYIEKEKEDIYRFVLPIMEKNEDVTDKNIKNTTTSLNKKSYTDNRIGIIQAYLPYVLDLIAGMDITLDILVKMVIPNPNYVNLVLTCVEDKGDIFKNYFCRYLADPDTRPSLISSIKLRLHDLYIDKERVENYMKKERK